MNRAHSQEEMAALYRRHVSMVYQICLMLLKTCRTRRTPPRMFFAR